MLAPRIEELGDYMNTYTICAPDEQGRISGQIGHFKFSATMDGGKLERLAVYDGESLIAQYGTKWDICPSTQDEKQAVNNLLEFLGGRE